MAGKDESRHDDLVWGPKPELKLTRVTRETELEGTKANLFVHLHTILNA